MNVEDACDYVKTINPQTDEGNVHLALKVFRKAPWLTREPGQFACKRSLNLSARHTRPATREEFCLEPCDRCLRVAERLAVDVGSLWQSVPGPRVKVYTTSPERRDRPYVGGGRTAGWYLDQEVRELLVPADFEAACLRHWQRAEYHAWDEATWLALVGSGRVKAEG